MSLKIIFMGTPEFAVPALKELLKEKIKYNIIPNIYKKNFS